MAEFKVVIKQRHFEEATSFMNPRSCPLYHALREIFPNVRLGVGGNNIDIDEYQDVPFNTNTWGADVTKICDDIWRAQGGESISEEYTVVFPDFPQELLDTINQEVIS